MNKNTVIELRAPFATSADLCVGPLESNEAEQWLTDHGFTPEKDQIWWCHNTTVIEHPNRVIHARVNARTHRLFDSSEVVLNNAKKTSKSPRL
ncbi:MAG: hypothetical protein A3H57_02645 [Candidatus Taylorbacteria bacterium RIFCSPLOWO2_02_FULL_43_11]|uniref:Uncharacterized protein n=1 Tax=Candidatus Taylorbacteria bacterium RIFCSPHIGHO2_02_FULL_43_32b TaxID=1802306 RepID=A0A1G2MFX8_9BACT|nr:MAG: hypothetical protein A2743_00395 [Candidatus Taylorbacteria bacterium RIFCSPHIGHO2_01_FULL_43_47]OHA22825.1 MAG: hypothetical protein A3C72_02840 [Candidatus Taylorbacteria bacterium RIFCSPHIGHO2_02_FULL_43_32b]OHA30879.1 MAG: hypothetical protein A3B08_01645 [Candidatus Taylorbacteria bacterium RIFCSPLOWO2_01_FULL_43_44]OHA35276.1 MAG: hypothetical protein A3H57_02645 [Candidatus Taylorbacteria bacterium RIFCSPLOWO2_02_FULL_43_11]